MLRHIILFLVATAHGPREKMLNMFLNSFPELYQWKILSSMFVIDLSVDSGAWRYLSNKGVCSFIIAVKTKQARFTCDMYTYDGTCFPAVNKKLVHQLRIHHSGFWRWLFTCFTWYMTKSYQNGLLYLCNSILATVCNFIVNYGCNVNYSENMLIGIASCFSIRQIVTFFINVSLDW